MQKQIDDLKNQNKAMMKMLIEEMGFGDEKQKIKRTNQMDKSFETFVKNMNV